MHLERRTIVMRLRSLMDFTLRCVCFYPRVNSRAELAPGLRCMARGLYIFIRNIYKPNRRALSANLFADTYKLNTLAPNHIRSLFAFSREKNCQVKNEF